MGPSQAQPLEMSWSCRVEKWGQVHGRGPQHPHAWLRRLALGTWSVATLDGKEPELLWEAEMHQLDIL